MEMQRLPGLVEQSEVHRRLLGEYGGSYSLGVTTTPTAPAEPAIRIRVEGGDDHDIPSEIILDGEPVPVLVVTRFVPPPPLTLRVRI